MKRLQCEVSQPEYEIYPALRLFRFTFVQLPEKFWSEENRGPDADSSPEPHHKPWSLPVEILTRRLHSPWTSLECRSRMPWLASLVPSGKLATGAETPAGAIDWILLHFPRLHPDSTQSTRRERDWNQFNWCLLGLLDGDLLTVVPCWLESSLLCPQSSQIFLTYFAYLSSTLHLTAFWDPLNPLLTRLA